MSYLSYITDYFTWSRTTKQSTVTSTNTSDSNKRAVPNIISLGHFDDCITPALSPNSNSEQQFHGCKRQNKNDVKYITVTEEKSITQTYFGHSSTHEETHREETRDEASNVKLNDDYNIESDSNDPSSNAEVDQINKIDIVDKEPNINKLMVDRHTQVTDTLTDMPLTTKQTNAENTTLENLMVIPHVYISICRSDLLSG